MRKLYWYLSLYFRKHGLVVLVAIILGIIIFSFVVPFLATALGSKQKVYIGLVGSYNLDSLPPNITQLISSGITRVEDDGTVIPDLAERWVVEDDGKTYRFILKKNLSWQDGKPLDTSDVHFQFNDVETVTTPNDIVFKLPEVYVPFPSSVSQPLIRTAVQRYWFFFERPTLIGLGAYRVQDYKQKGNRLSELVLENNQEQLIYRFYLTEQEAVLAYERGEVDRVPDLTAPPEVKDWPTVQVTSTLNKNRYLAVFFNLEDPLFPKNVRQALSYATNRPTDDTRANGPISSQSWAYLAGVKNYDYDLARATDRLLTNMDQMANQPITFELVTIPTFESEADQLKKDWENLGRSAFSECQTRKEITDKSSCQKVQITVNIRITSFPDTSNFQALLIGEESPPDPDQYYLWHSNQPTNFTHYQNTRIDSLLEKGRVTQDKTERLAIYQEFQQFFLEDAPAVFLKYLPSYEIQRK